MTILDEDDAVAVAMEAFGIERRFINCYHCEACDVEWTDEWSCACDDECPECGRDFSPYDSDEVLPPDRMDHDVDRIVAEITARIALKK